MTWIRLFFLILRRVLRSSLFPHTPLYRSLVYWDSDESNMLDVRARDRLYYLYFVTSLTSCVPLRACMCMYRYLLRCTANLYNFSSGLKYVMISATCISLTIIHYQVQCSIWVEASRNYGTWVRLAMWVQLSVLTGSECYHGRYWILLVYWDSDKSNMLDVRARDCLCYLYFVTSWSSCVPLRACMCMYG